ncbi:valine--tRNA ligase [archaeon]|jgi:valyl-tRNA synthetase|nr:valine--tRNA ligase [archaeon]MBT7128158.1 valine--tRNA ligase [archaeon]
MAKKGYDFKEAEPRLMQLWQDKKIYKFDSDDTTTKIFSFDTPPPTVSGALHMGHAFGDAQQDFIARFKRMRGFNVLNPFGTDNNGLPTLRLVEKEKGIKASDMTRTEFIDICLKAIKEEYVPGFLKDAKRLGTSADWELFYSTIDARSRRISQKSFIDLYKQGREYRTKCPSLWCTTCQTTIAQVELEDETKQSTFNDITFKLDNKDLTIATTRPELLPACVAIFVNPTDKRYKELVGKSATVPLFNFQVPIMTDERADPEKGSGAVMCCTFGDQTDMEWQKQYNLEIKEAISPDGKMTKLAEKYCGLKVAEARKQIIEDLKKAKLLTKQETITHDVNVHERCQTPIEFINSKQWFVKYLDIKDDMIKWGLDVKWHPDHMKHRYTNWVKGLKWDWCISRQIPFGIPFPVWYCKECDEPIMADESQLPVDPLEDSPPVQECPKCKCKKFTPEEDIMNTWATSALTPDITKDLLKDTPIYNKIKDKPFSIRRNGHDIITFWDFNSVVKSQLHHKRNPWEELMINGWMLGKDGKKMSKSRNNGISPQETVEEHGADVLRYLCAAAKLGDDIAFPEQELIKGKKLINKLYNASKFVFMNLKDYKDEKPKQLEKIDEEFLKHLDNLISQVTKYFEAYSYSHAKELTERFFFDDFANDYIEIVKKRIYNETGDKKISAQYTLKKSLLTILKLFAPIMPFVTEEIYQTYYKEQESIHITEWPELKENSEPSIPFQGFQEILSKIRQEKTTAQKSMNSEITLTLEKETIANLEAMTEDLKSVTAASEIKEGDFKVEFN